jgi:hypothetical protein
VLHAIAGPVDANTFLYEARWIVNVHHRASLEGRDDPARYRQVVRDAHADRLERDFDIRRSWLNRVNEPAAVDDGGFASTGPLTKAKMDMLWVHRNHPDNRARVHLLAALFPLEKVEAVYKYVFESILRESVSSLPVVER